VLTGFSLEDWTWFFELDFVGFSYNWKLDLKTGLVFFVCFNKSIGCLLQSTFVAGFRALESDRKNLLWISVKVDVQTLITD
jgi:hypothetical protein